MGMREFIRKISQNIMVEGHNQYKTFLIGVILGIINVLIGILLLFLGQSIKTSLGPFLFIISFIYSGANFFSAWLAWRGNVKIGFDFILVASLIQLLNLSLISSGYGLLLGILAFVFPSILVFEIIDHKRINSILLISGLYGPLLFLLDSHGPENRVQASGILVVALWYLVVVVLALFMISFIKNFRSINIIAKFAIPVILFAYLITGGIAFFTNNQLDRLPDYLFPPGSEAQTESSLERLANWIENWQDSTRLISVIGLMAATIVLSRIASLVFSPFTHLADLSRKVLDGNMNVRANISSREEIGSVAEGFNFLVSRLRQVSDTLDLRVADRTRILVSQKSYLDRKVDILQSVLEISRVLVKAWEFDQFLPITVNTIREHLGFKHISILLIDRSNRQLVLRAASSEEGQRLLNLGYSIQIDQDGSLQDVIRNGVIKIISEADREKKSGKSYGFLQFQSELCLPLSYNGVVIGVLDIQDETENTFSEDDLGEFSILAELVSSIYQRLFDIQTTSDILEELELRQKAMSKQAWEEYLLERSENGYRYYNGVISTLNKDEITSHTIDWARLGDEGLLVAKPETTQVKAAKTITSEDFRYSDRGPTIIAPISLRGELVGAIKLQELDPSRIWTEDELALVRAVTEQVGMALENSQLVEETRRRADHEAIVTDIFSQLRSSSEPQVIQQSALEALQRALQVKSVRIVFRDEAESLARIKLLETGVKDGDLQSNGDS